MPQLRDFSKGQHSSWNIQKRMILEDLGVHITHTSMHRNKILPLSSGISCTRAWFHFILNQHPPEMTRTCIELWSKTWITQNSWSRQTALLHSKTWDEESSQVIKLLWWEDKIDRWTPSGQFPFSLWYNSSLLSHLLGAEAKIVQILALVNFRWWECAVHFPVILLIHLKVLNLTTHEERLMDPSRAHPHQLSTARLKSN